MRLRLLPSIVNIVVLLVSVSCAQESPAPEPVVKVLEITSAISEKTSYSDLIPHSTPVISTNMSYVMRGEFSFLSIYVDGEIVYIEEKGLRSPGYPAAIRTWKTGKLSHEELDSLLGFVKNSGFQKLNNYYKFPGKPTQGGGFSMGDMDYAVSVNYADWHQMVYAIGYLTPDRGLTYPDMPSPLEKIYKKLRDIAVNETQEVARENITASLAWE